MYLSSIKYILISVYTKFADKKAATPEKTIGYGFNPLEKIWFYSKLTLDSGLRRSDKQENVIPAKAGIYTELNAEQKPMAPGVDPEFRNHQSWTNPKESIHWKRNRKKNLIYLMRLGHLINVLAIYSERLVKIVRDLGVRGLIRFIRSTLSGPWLDPLRVKERIAAPFQLRLI